jgi:Sensors of blue-light using FAD
MHGMAFFDSVGLVQTALLFQRPRSNTVYEILYVSTIAPNAPLSIVGDIARKSRQANKLRDITGLLIFDGMHFSQQLEGKQSDVLRLVDRIAQDPRHVNVQVLHHAPLSERRFSRFSMGYASLADDEELGRLEMLDGQTAMNAFLTFQAHADLDSDDALP